MTRNNQMLLEVSDVDGRTSAPLDLYDLLPFGYVRLDKEGMMRQANLTVAALLGAARDGLLDSRFSDFFQSVSGPAFGTDFSGMWQTGREQTWRASARGSGRGTALVVLKSRVIPDPADDRGRLEISVLPVNAGQSADCPPAEAPEAADSRVRPLPGALPGIWWTVNGRCLWQASGMASAALPQGVQARRVKSGPFFSAEFAPWAAHRRALEGHPAGYELFSGDSSFFSYVEPVRNRAGRVVGAAGMAYDATPLKRMENKLRDLSRRIILVEEEERRAFARELHDQVGQMIAMLGLAVGQARNSPPEKVGEALNDAHSLVKDLMSQVHQLSLDLRPDMLEDLGLLPTLASYLKRYTEQTRVSVDFKHNGLGVPLPLETATAAYRIVQEALTNVARHAGVGEAVLRLWADGESLYVQIEDRGKGFDPAECTGDHFVGLSGMIEKAECLGGRMSIESAPGKGTQLMAELPLLQ